MFELSAEYQLDLAMPSWCSTQDTVSKHTAWAQMQGNLILHYTTYVETIAVLWSRAFWTEHIVSSLKDAEQGVILIALAVSASA